MIRDRPTECCALGRPNTSPTNERKCPWIGEAGLWLVKWLPSAEHVWCSYDRTPHHRRKFLTRDVMAHLLLLLACFAAANANVIVLDDRSYDDETKNGIWLVEFYAVSRRNLPCMHPFVEALTPRRHPLRTQPWCGHCKHLAPIYDEAALRLADKPINLGLHERACVCSAAPLDRLLPACPAAKIDATANPVLTARYDIKGYPRLVYKVDDSEVRAAGPPHRSSPPVLCSCWFPCRWSQARGPQCKEPISLPRARPFPSR